MKDLLICKNQISEIVAPGKDPLTADVEEIVESANEKLEKTILPEDENDELDKKKFSCCIFTQNYESLLTASSIASCK